MLAVVATSATAHHSPASYDLKKVITVTGAVTKYQWANPHVYIYVAQKTDTGETIDWEIEGGPPSLMRRVGLGRDSMQIGDVLTIKGYPAKNERNKALFPYLVQRGDRTLLSFADFAKLGAPADAGKAASIAGVWSTTVNFKTIGITASPPASKLTPKGAEALGRFDEKTTPTSNCIPIPAPSAMITPDLKRIAIDDGVLYLETEAEGSRRTVHMNTATHAGARPSIQGHSIGRWDGATLVVDTTHFAYHGSGNGGGNGIGPALPSGSQKHLVERFSLNPDGKSLTYRFELNDPEYLTAPKTGELPFWYDPKAKFEVEACDLEVARRFMKD
jgi:Family of unknown function (DUF6152)